VCAAAGAGAEKRCIPHFHAVILRDNTLNPKPSWDDSEEELSQNDSFSWYKRHHSKDTARLSLEAEVRQRSSWLLYCINYRPQQSEGCLLHHPRRKRAFKFRQILEVYVNSKHFISTYYGMSYFDAAPGYFDASSVHPSTSPHHTNFYGDARHDSVSVKTRIIHETASTTATITKLH
jgi:hypothetical protein